MSDVGGKKAFRVRRWQLWDGTLTREQAELMGRMAPLLEELRASGDPILLTYFEIAQWRWKQWEYSTLLGSLDLDHAQRYRVVDAGCGYTPLIRFLGGLGMEAHGFDWDKTRADSQLSRAATLLQGDRVRFSNQDMRQIDWPSDYFDYTLSVSVLEHLFCSPHLFGKVLDYFLPPARKYFHVQNVARAVHELVRITKPGGRLLLTLDCGYGGGIRVPVAEEIFGIRIEGFPDVETIRSYWRSDPYYSNQNTMIPSTPREYVALFLDIEKPA